MPTPDLLTSLFRRRPNLDTLEPLWQLIDDVLAARFKRRHGDTWSSPYLPKGRLEPDAEYTKRVELTPFFPETPQLLASRLGALFRTRLQIDNNTDPRMQHFVATAGRHHASLEDLAAQAASLSQCHGFCAALLDRDPLPPDLHNRDFSEAEAAARNIGRPYLALYAANEILDWDYAPDGHLAWVKFGEQETIRANWDSPAAAVRTIRIVDRAAINVFRVHRDASSEWKVEAAPPVPHGFPSTVPIAFLHPFPAQDGIGRPILHRAAEADIAAARILSDLIWDLYLLGNPILTLKTGKTDEELVRLGLGATRYLPLSNGRPGLENAEDLSFVKLDPTGIELLFRAHALFASKAARQAGSSGEESSIPREQSGVAQAWRFKTGEERILFLLARALEPFLNRCLSFATQALNIDTPAPTVRLPESFDVTTPAESLETAAEILNAAERFKQPELAKIALERYESALGTLPAARRDQLRRERDQLTMP